MQVALHGVGLEEDEVFFEGAGLGDHRTIRSEHQAGAIEDKLVVPADLIHQHNRRLVMLGDGLQHLQAQLALAHPKRRGRDIQHEVGAAAHQLFHRIHAIKPPVPELLVVPSVFADGERHLPAAEGQQCLLARGREVAHFIEHVVSGQQHLRLHEFDFAVAQQASGIHHRFAGFHLGAGGKTADDGNAARLLGNGFHRLAAALHEGGFFHPVARGIPADGHLGKENEAGATLASALRVLDDFFTVAGEIPNRGIDLAEGDLHNFSLSRLSGAGKPRHY